jgi:hypothetical protein
MAVISDDIVYERQSHHGGTPTPRTYPEAATQTFVKGEIGFMSAGYLKEIAGDTPEAIIGVIAQAAHNDATAGTSSCSVFLASEGIVFEANVKASGLANYVGLNSDVGRVMGIQRDTANSKVFLNASVVGGANARVFVHGYARGSAAGDTNPRMLFEFLPTYIQNRATS